MSVLNEYPDATKHAPTSLETTAVHVNQDCILSTLMAMHVMVCKQFKP